MASKTLAVVVGTWAFSAQPVTMAAQYAGGGATCEDCLEKALNVAEEDAKYGPCHVGRGGPPNEKGEVELDAAIMSGRDLNFGAVTALRGISRASSVARCVMEKSPHSMLTSQGAQDFALKCGFQLDMPLTQNISGDGSSQAYGSPEMVDTRHGEASYLYDTLGLLVLDSHGNIAADNEVGAVCCSGEGDEIMKFCPSILVMESMRQGMSPETACQGAVKRIQQRRAPSPPFELAIIAVNTKGDVGVASTVREWKDPTTGVRYPGFPFVVWRADDTSGAEPEVIVEPPVS